MQEPKFALQMTDITKRFPGVLANDRISLDECLIWNASARQRKNPHK